MSPKMPLVHRDNERKILAESLLIQKPIINVDEARRILGVNYISMTDTQVLELIRTLHLIAREYIRTRGSKR